VSRGDVLAAELTGHAIEALTVTGDEADGVALAPEAAGDRRPDPRAGADDQQCAGTIAGGSIRHASSRWLSESLHRAMRDSPEAGRSNRVLA
jgi:hypothetical protein